jgi:5,10-methylenetetrahydromethanopterin reductase
VARLKSSVLLVPRFPPEQLIRLAQLTESHGYDAFWLADERFFREVHTHLTLAALHTERIALGPMVTDPYIRHPAVSAMAIASVDEIARGRAIFGLGAGVSGFREMRINRRKPATAIKETVQVVRALLEGGAVDFAGEVIQLDGGHLNFTPIRPEIPVYIASYGPLGLIVAGEVADGAVIQGAVADGMVQWIVDNVREGATRAGRDPAAIDIVSRVNVCISDDPRAAKDAMRTGLVATLVSQYPEFRIFQIADVRVPAELATVVAAFRETHGYTHDAEATARLAALVPDEIVDAFTLAGTLDEVTKRLTRIVERGVTHVMVYPVAVDGDIETTITRFATEVLPTVRAAVGDDTVVHVGGAS